MNQVNIRTVFIVPGQRRNSKTPHPLDQFLFWFQDAITQYGDETNAMTMATPAQKRIDEGRNVYLTPHQQEDMDGFYIQFLYHLPEFFADKTVLFLLLSRRNGGLKGEHLFPYFLFFFHEIGALSLDCKNSRKPKF